LNGGAIPVLCADDLAKGVGLPSVAWMGGAGSVGCVCRSSTCLLLRKFNARTSRRVMDILRWIISVYCYVMCPAIPTGIGWEKRCVLR